MRFQRHKNDSKIDKIESDLEATTAPSAIDPVAESLAAVTKRGRGSRKNGMKKRQESSPLFMTHAVNPCQRKPNFRRSLAKILAEA